MADPRDKQPGEDSLAWSKRLREMNTREYGVGSGQQPQAPQPPAPAPAAPPPPPSNDPATWGQSRKALREGRYSSGGMVPYPNNFLNAVGYAEGGMVGMQQAAPSNFMNAVGYQNGGQPGLPPNGPQQGSPMDFQMVDGQLSQMLASNPEAKAQIQQVVREALATGELTPQELNKIVELAKAAQQNPQIWPQLRNFVIQQGIAEQDDIPQQFDQGLVSTILLIAKAAQEDLQGGGMPQGPGVQPPQGMGQGPVQSRANGGMIQGPGTGTSDSIPGTNVSDGSAVKVSNGEYIVPASVVQAKGVDFFDGLVRKYHTPGGYRK